MTVTLTLTARQVSSETGDISAEKFCTLQPAAQRTWILPLVRSVTPSITWRTQRSLSLPWTSRIDLQMLG